MKFLNFISDYPGQWKIGEQKLGEASIPLKYMGNGLYSVPCDIFMVHMEDRPYPQTLKKGQLLLDTGHFTKKPLCLIPKEFKDFMKM